MAVTAAAPAGTRARRPVTLALGALLALLASPSAAQEPEGDAGAPACPPRAPPQVSQRVRDPEPVLSTARTGELDGAADRPQAARTHHLGLTVSRVEWSSELTARFARGPDGVCAVPAEVELSLAHVEHAIRLAREIPRDGCLWREVLGHERRHVEVNRRTLREAAARIRDLAGDWAVRAEARGADAETAVATLQRDLRRAVEPALARMRADRLAGHEAIDVPAEYRRLSRVCGPDQIRLREALRAR
jgi:hypothetical protein